MKKKYKILLFVSLIIICCAIPAMTIKIIRKGSVTRQIPVIQGASALTLPLQQQISEALKRARHHPTADNLGTLGMVYQANSFYDEAVQCYLLAVKRNKSSWLWNYYLGYISREMGESQKVMDHFNKVVLINPAVYHAWFYLGEEYKKTGNLAQAVSAWGKISDLPGSSARRGSTMRNDYFKLSVYAKFQLGSIYLDSKDTAKAEKTLLELISDNRSFGPAYRLLGNIYNLKGDSASGKRYTVRANDLIPYSSPVDTLIDRLSLLSRSDLYLLKKIDEAEKSVYPEWALKLIKNGLTYLPENKHLLSKAIMLYLMTGHDEQAFSFLDQHLHYFGDDYNELRDMGDLLYTRKYFSQSIPYYRQALQLKPDDTDLQNCLVLSTWYSGMKEQALDLLKGIIERNAQFPDILADDAMLLLRFGQNEYARAMVNKLKVVAPKRAKVQKALGMMAETEGKTGEAIRLYEAAFRSDPKDIALIKDLGRLLMQQKLWKQSIDHYKNALESYPNDPFLLERLGTLLVSCPDPSVRNIREGKEYAERAFIHATSQSTTLVSAGASLALAYASLGDCRNANNILKMTVNLASGEKSPTKFIKELQARIKQKCR